MSQQRASVKRAKRITRRNGDFFLNSDSKRPLSSRMDDAVWSFLELDFQYVWNQNKYYIKFLETFSFYAVWVLVPGRRHGRRANPRDPPSLMARGGMDPRQSQPPEASGSSKQEIASSVDHASMMKVFSFINTYFPVMSAFSPVNTCQVCH